MDSQRSTPRECDDDMDQLCRSFANAFLSPAREAASRANNLTIKSPPQPVGLQDYDSSKRDVSGGADPFSVTSRTQRTEASQSKSLRPPSTLPITEPQGYTAGRDAINLSPDPLRGSSSTQSTAARHSLVVQPPLPNGVLGLQNGASNKTHKDNHPSQSPSSAGGEEARPRNVLPIPARAGFVGPQNEISTSLASDLGSTPSTTPPGAHRQKARQSRGVPVPNPGKRKRSNRLDVLRPDRFKIRSRAQEVVFEAAGSLLALERYATRSFFELPAELRLIIYEYALTSQSAITPRLDGAQQAESKEAPVAAAVSPTQAKASSLALLQTCRLVDREARPVYYASNTFRFTSAKDLVDFLHGIGPDLLNKLRKLHIEGLLTVKPLFPAEQIERYRKEGMSKRLCQSLAKMRGAKLDDNANIGARMLKQCSRLHRIHLSMGRREEKFYILWLTTITGYSNATIEFVDDGRWLPRPSASVASAHEWHKTLEMALADPASHRALFPDLKKGQRRCIDVDLDMDRLMKEGWWSRIGLMV